MTVSSLQPAAAAASSTTSESAAAHKRDERNPAARHTAETLRFRALLAAGHAHAPAPGNAAVLDACAVREPAGARIAEDRRHHADAGAAMQAATLHAAALAPPPADVTATGSGDAADRIAFAELLQRHVERLLIPPSDLAYGASAAVILRLAEDTLPQAELRLSREHGGWRLLAVSSDAATADVLRAQLPQLARRFQHRQLGELDVEVQESPS
jgi:hypothetical protein